MLYLNLLCKTPKPELTHGTKQVIRWWWPLTAGIADLPFSSVALRSAVTGHRDEAARHVGGRKSLQNSAPRWSAFDSCACVVCVAHSSPIQDGQRKPLCGGPWWTDGRSRGDGANHNRLERGKYHDSLLQQKDSTPRSENLHGENRGVSACLVQNRQGRWQRRGPW